MNISPPTEIKVPFSWLFLTPGLSPSSRFIWLHLHLLLERSTTAFVEGDVKTLSARLCVSDKTFKKAVDELRAEKLLKRRKCKTSLGANSFRYIPVFREDMFLHSSESQICINGETLRHPSIPGEAKKLTVSQRLLLVVVKSFSAGVGVVTSMNVRRLSKLTGIREINIYSNLAKLAELECLIRVISPSKHHSTASRKWAFMKYSGENSFAIDFLITRNPSRNEIWRACLLLNKDAILQEINETELESQNIEEEIENLRIRWTTESLLEQPFPALPPETLEQFKTTLNENKNGFKTAIDEIGPFHFDFLICFAAIQILSGNCFAVGGPWLSRMKWTNAYLLGLDLLADLSLPLNTKKQIAKIIQGLAEIMVPSLKGELSSETKVDFINARLIQISPSTISIKLDSRRNPNLDSNTIYTVPQSETYRKTKI